MPIAAIHIGTAHYAFKSMIRDMGGELVEPPPTSHHTLSLGTRHSPETVCLPFKLILGNFIEALELGADTLVFPTSFGPCRMGYYARTHQRILQELGYHFRMVTFGAAQGILKPAKSIFPNASTARIIKSLVFGIAKLAALDALQDACRKARAMEKEIGSATHILSQGMEAVEQAGDYGSLKRVKRDYLEKFEKLHREEGEAPLRVAMLGEIYVVMETFPNYDMEVELGKLRVEVRRPQSWWWWLKGKYVLPFFSAPDEKKWLRQAALPYLRRDIGGEAWETVGGKRVYARLGYDGLIHLLPFTCMPEIMAQNIMPTTPESLPVLTIICDEQMGKAGLVTRLEAFTDLLSQRRHQLRRQPA